jgi:hypothetical protein
MLLLAQHALVEITTTVLDSRSYTNRTKIYVAIYSAVKKLMPRPSYSQRFAGFMLLSNGICMQSCSSKRLLPSPLEGSQTVGLDPSSLFLQIFQIILRLVCRNI